MTYQYVFVVFSEFKTVMLSLIFCMTFVNKVEKEVNSKV